MLPINSAAGCASDAGISRDEVAVFPHGMAAFPNRDARHLLFFWNPAGKVSSFLGVSVLGW